MTPRVVRQENMVMSPVGPGTKDLLEKDKNSLPKPKTTKGTVNHGTLGRVLVIGGCNQAMSMRRYNSRETWKVP
jgi:hypothetical protein